MTIPKVLLDPSTNTTEQIGRTEPKLRLLDLYSCAGGAAAGYTAAGFTVTGVDITPQPRYPYPFRIDDALLLLNTLTTGSGATFSDGNVYDLDDFDAIHASPPCQRYSAGTRATDRDKHPDLVAATRDALNATGKPWIIENVPGAPLNDPTLLCGRMFGLTALDTDGTHLQLDRHRMFETNWFHMRPPTCQPHDKTIQVAGSYGGARRDKHEARTIRHGGYVPTYEVQQQLLGIDWMLEREMYQAIPPAYTEWIGIQLRHELTAAA